MRKRLGKLKKLCFSTVLVQQPSLEVTYTMVPASYVGTFSITTAILPNPSTIMLYQRQFRTIPLDLRIWARLPHTLREYIIVQLLEERQWQAKEINENNQIQAKECKTLSHIKFWLPHYHFHFLTHHSLRSNWSPSWYLSTPIKFQDFSTSCSCCLRHS